MDACCSLGTLWADASTRRCGRRRRRDGGLQGPIPRRPHAPALGAAAAVPAPHARAVPAFGRRGATPRPRTAALMVLSPSCACHGRAPSPLLSITSALSDQITGAQTIYLDHHLRHRCVQRRRTAPPIGSASDVHRDEEQGGPKSSMLRLLLQLGLAARGRRSSPRPLRAAARAHGTTSRHARGARATGRAPARRLSSANRQRRLAPTNRMHRRQR